MEMVDSISPTDSSLSRIGNSQSVIVYRTDASNLTDPQKNDELVTTILGGYLKSDLETHHKPLNHPYFKGMWATEIVSIKHKGKPDISSGTTQPYATYDFVDITILFQTLPYYVDKNRVPNSDGSGWNPNWISQETKASNSYVNAPLGMFFYRDGEYAGKSAALGAYIHKPSSAIHLTVHQVPAEKLFLQDDDKKTILIRGTTGFVNQNIFLGCAVWTLMLDSIEVIPYGDAFGVRRYYDVRVSLLYNGWGWNSVLDMSNVPNVVLSKHIDGSMGGTPFLQGSIDSVFAEWNP
jgi:hypothetical protein